MAKSTAIENIKHLAAFDDLFKARFESFDLSAVMMYMIDTAPEAALYHLAEQFNVLGLKGWNLAITEADKRALIKKAIFLHRHSGTPFAVKESIKAVGFGDVELKEGIGLNYDGEEDYNGAVVYFGGNWATFRAVITLPPDRLMNAAEQIKLIGLINEWKNARSLLLDLSFRLLLSDALEYEEFLDLGEGIEEFTMAGAYYNGGATYNGAQTYNKGADVVSLTIINTLTGEIINDEF